MTSRPSGNVPDMSIEEVSVEALETAMAAGARVVDVREIDEYCGGHVPGAVLVALATVSDHIDVFRCAGGQPSTHVICAAGARSMRACEFLAEHGISVVNVAGGTRAWVASGRPVVTGDASL